MAHLEDNTDVLSTVEVDIYLNRAEEEQSTECLNWDIPHEIEIKEDELISPGFIQVKDDTCTRTLMVEVSSEYGWLLREGNSTMSRSIVVPHFQLASVKYQADEHWNGMDKIVFRDGNKVRVMHIHVLPEHDEVEIRLNTSLQLSSAGTWQSIGKVFHLIDIDQTFGTYRLAEELLAFQLTTSTGRIKSEHFRGDNQMMVIRGFARQINKELLTLSYAHASDALTAKISAQLYPGKEQEVSIIVLDDGEDGSLRLPEVVVDPSEYQMDATEDGTPLSEMFNITHVPIGSYLKVYALKGRVSPPSGKHPPFRMDNASFGNEWLAQIIYVPEASPLQYKDVIRLSINGHVTAQKIVSVRPSITFPLLQVTEETVLAKSSGGLVLNNHVELKGAQSATFSLHINASHGQFRVIDGAALLPWISKNRSEIRLAGDLSSIQQGKSACLSLLLALTKLAALGSVVYHGRASSSEDSLTLALKGNGQEMKQTMRIEMEKVPVVSFVNGSTECSPTSLELPRIATIGLPTGSALTVSVTTLLGEIMLGEMKDEAPQLLSSSPHEVVLEGSSSSLNNALAKVTVRQVDPPLHAVVDLLKVKLGNGATWSCEILVRPSPVEIPASIELLATPAAPYLPLLFSCADKLSSQDTRVVDWDLVVSAGQLHEFIPRHSTVSLAHKNDTALSFRGDVASTLELLASEAFFFEPPDAPVSIRLSVTSPTASKTFSFRHTNGTGTDIFLLHSTRRVLHARQGMSLSIGEAITVQHVRRTVPAKRMLVLWRVTAGSGTLEVRSLSGVYVESNQSGKELRMEMDVKQATAAMKRVVFHGGRCGEEYHKVEVEVEKPFGSGKALVWVLVQPVDEVFFHGPGVIQLEQGKAQQSLPGIGATSECRFERRVRIRFTPPMHGMLEFTRFAGVELLGGNGMEGSVENINAALQKAVYSPDGAWIGIDSFELSSSSHSWTVLLNVSAKVEAPQIRLAASTRDLHAWQDVSTPLNLSLAIIPPFTVGNLTLNVSVGPSGKLSHFVDDKAQALQFSGSSVQLTRYLENVKYMTDCSEERFEDKLQLQVSNEKGKDSVILPIQLHCRPPAILQESAASATQRTVKQHSEVSLFLAEEPLLVGDRAPLNLSVTWKLNSVSIPKVVPGVYQTSLPETKQLFLFGMVEYVDEAVRSLTYSAIFAGNDTLEITLPNDEMILINVSVMSAPNLAVSVISPLLVLHSGETISIRGVKVEDSGEAGRIVGLTASVEQGRLSVGEVDSAIVAVNLSARGVHLTGLPLSITGALHSLTYTAASNFTGIDTLELASADEKILATIELHVLPRDTLPSLEFANDKLPNGAYSEGKVDLNSFLQLDVPEGHASKKGQLKFTVGHRPTLDKRRIRLVNVDAASNTSFTLLLGSHRSRKLGVNASASEVASALEDLPGIHAVHASSTMPLEWEITFLLPAKGVRPVTVSGVEGTVIQEEAASGQLEVWEIRTSSGRHRQIFSIRLEATSSEELVRGNFQLLAESSSGLTATSAAIDHTAVATIDEERSTWSPGTGGGESVEARLAAALLSLFPGHSAHISVTASAEGCRKLCSSHDQSLALKCYRNEDCDRCAGRCARGDAPLATGCLHDGDCPFNSTCLLANCYSSGISCDSQADCKGSGSCLDSDCSFVGQGGVVWRVVVDGIPAVSLSVASSSVANANVIVREELQRSQVEGSFDLVVNGRRTLVSTNASAEDISTSAMLASKSDVPEEGGQSWIIVPLETSIRSSLNVDGNGLVGDAASVRAKRLGGESLGDALKVEGREVKRVAGGVEVTGKLMELRNWLLRPNSINLQLPVSFSGEVQVVATLKMGDEDAQTLNASMNFSVQQEERLREVVVNSSTREGLEDLRVPLQDLLIIKDDLLHDSIYDLSMHVTHGRLSFDKISSVTPLELSVALKNLSFFPPLGFTGMATVSLDIQNNTHTVPIIVHPAAAKPQLSFNPTVLRTTLDADLYFNLYLSRTRGSGRILPGRLTATAAYGRIEALPNVHLHNTVHTAQGVSADVRLGSATLEVSFRYIPRNVRPPSKDSIRVELLEEVAEVEVEVSAPRERFKIEALEGADRGYAAMKEDEMLRLGKVLAVYDMDSRVDGRAIRVKVSTGNSVHQAEPAHPGTALEVAGSFALGSMERMERVLANASTEDFVQALSRVINEPEVRLLNASRSLPIQGGYLWEAVLDVKNCSYLCLQNIQSLWLRGEELLGAGSKASMEVLHEHLPQQSINISVSAAPGQIVLRNSSASTVELLIENVAGVTLALDEVQFLPPMNWNSFTDGIDARVNLSIANATSYILQVYVDPVSDDPVITLPGEVYGVVAHEDGISMKPVFVQPYYVIEDQETRIHNVSLRNVDEREAQFRPEVGEVADVLQVSLACDHGTLTLGRPISGANISFQASVSEANELLRELRYTPLPDFYGNDTLLITLNDFENAGASDGPGAAMASLPIIVMPTADPLHLRFPKALQYCDEDSGLLLERIFVDDPDVVESMEEDGDLVKVVILSDAGSVWVDEQFNVTVTDNVTTIVGSLLEVNRALEGAVYYPRTHRNTFAAAPQVIKLEATRGAFTTSGKIFVHVRAINDAPTIHAAATLETMEDVDLRLDGNIWVSDVDVEEGGTGELQVRLTAQRGRLFLLRDTPGVSLREDLPNSILIVGKPKSVNLAIARTFYKPADDWSGNDLLTVDVSDLGNTGEGGALESHSTVEVIVHPVNDRPRWQLPSHELFGSSSLAEVQLHDVDAFSEDLSVRVVAGEGLLVLGDASGRREIQMNGTLDQLNLQLRQLRYVSRGSNDEILFVANDNGHSGSGGAEVGHAGRPVIKKFINLKLTPLLYSLKDHYGCQENVVASSSLKRRHSHSR